MAAVEDNTRLCRFIYENLHVITEIHATLDTHKAAQIFHALFWVNQEGEHPAPMTVISVEDVEAGLWRINPDVSGSAGTDSYERLSLYARHYVRELRDRSKYELTIWPYHAILGGIGHALVSSVEEALFFHTIARRSQTGFEVKGDVALTEHYSVLDPEVEKDHEGNEIARKNTAFLDTLLEFDAVVVAGQAKSHCLAWTMEDLLSEIVSRREELAHNVYLLEDCTSPVVVPGVIDFTDAADEAFDRFARAGMNVVRTTQAMEQWGEGALAR
jgi:nicotinamidase-related amidase